MSYKNTDILTESSMVELARSGAEFQLEDVEGSITDRFHKQVDRHGDRIGIKTSTYALTYLEIDRFANRIATEIIDRCGLEKGQTIGLFFGRDEMVIMTMLGVLKAGKIAVAIDSTQQIDRLKYLIADSQPVLIVTNDLNFAVVKDLAPSTQLLNIDRLDTDLTTANLSADRQINLAISPDDLACIIYTSGSTGQPKGTLYNHRCLLHLVKRYTDTLKIQPEDRMLLISSSGHMAGMNTIFRALLNGATVFPFDLDRQGLDKLVDWLVTEKITVYNSVPTIFRQLVSNLNEQENFPDLRILLLGGEIVTKRDVDLFKRYFSPDCILINNVGCTEFSCYRQYFVDRHTQVSDTILPVGYPVAGAEVLLLDDTGQEVGFDCIGEIAIDSRYLALGYWRQPALTAAKFLPADRGTDRRIYRTGDLGRMLPDGCLIHLGRKDAQIEIDGYRVEIVAIEMMLLEHPDIKQAAVVVEARESESPQLLAYVAIDRQHAADRNFVMPSPSDLQNLLRLKLPAYMVPKQIVFLDALPLHPSGKVDLRTLGSLTADRDNTIDRPTAPAEIERSIPSRFEQQVRAHPDRLAVKTHAHQLTAAQLNRAANRLARSILVQTKDRHEPIPILFEHGAMMLIAMLGVLKAGKSWVPIDPWYPSARISSILRTYQATVLIVNQRNLPLATQVLSEGCQIINLDDIDLSISAENLDLEISPAAIACILPTSGSTGEPKGVVHNHRNLLHAGMRWTKAFGIRPEDRSLLVNSYCHVGGINNIFSAVLNGAAVYPYNLKESGLANLADWLMTEKITIYHSVSTVFRHFIDSLTDRHKFPEVRLIHLGGESVFKQDFELYKQHFGVNCIFLNSFGCTEISSYRQYFIDSAKPRLRQRTTEITSNVIPIGYAAEDIEVILLDDRGKPVVGDNPIGEIVVQSEYLALGYWQRPDLDALSFLPDPTGGNRRLYRTGDLGQMLPDGCLIHLGRKDFQVQIRGYRVELSECEAALSEHPQLKEVAVVARYSNAEIAKSNEEIEQSSIAYIVPYSGEIVSSRTLYEFLQQKLPSYLIPAGFVFMDALPINANGKIDRLALPQPQAADLQSSTVYVAPSTPLEQQLAEIWAEVLKRDRVGIFDNFFELGGHSLLASQVGLRIESRLQIALSLQQLWIAPTIAKLAAVLSHSQTEQIVIPRRSAEIQFLPLSSAQQRLWLLEQLDPDRADYHLHTAWQFTGDLNLAALQQALDAIVAHHEVLRTNFISDRDRPLQVIRSERSVELLLLDCQSYPQPDRDREIARRLQQECLRTFDLERDLMLRGCVLQIDRHEQILLVVLHHIAFDGWSMGIFTAQLQELYVAFCHDRLPQLPDLPIQYADFAVWQRQYLQDEVLATHLNYWQQQMSGAPALLSLPTDRSRPAIQTFSGGSCAFKIDRDLTSALSRLSQQSGATLFMTLLAAFNTLLYRYTGSEDLVVGAPIASRDRRELTGLIGFFANTLVLRTDVAGNPNFLELLERVKKVAVGAYTHQDVPFELLVEKLQPQRDLSYSPLFQVMFAFEEDVAPRQLELPNLITSPYQLSLHTAQFDLTLCLEKQAEGLVGRWEYNTDLFDRATIDRLVGHFQTLLQGIIANPHQPISQLPILTAAERDRLLLTWNQTQTADPQDKCIHQLFEEQVELHPDRLAVVLERQQLTYRELNTRANQLAHHLSTLGVKADALVGISTNRSLETIVGILGILKAGGAYVPLDPAYPRERLALIIEDAAISVLLTQSCLIENLPAHHAQVVRLDVDLPNLPSAQNFTTEVAPHNLAYVMYTSGSTGTPKGVLIEHRSLVNYAVAAKHEYKAVPTDRILQFASLNFDISAEEIYTCLTAGATLVLRTEETIELGTFVRQCREWEITVVSLPTAYWHELTIGLETDNLILPPSLRLVIIGGEQVAAARFSIWRERVGAQVRLVNTYGPTEATISVLWSDLSALALDPTNLEIPIGRPIPNIQAYILDRQLQPVPIGVPGELYVGGAGLARGYLNRPDLTAAAFIPNPFSQEYSGRLYKTGDLTRYRSDGKIEYLGRIDNQVKIRGFRIELGEIETLLDRHPAIEQALAIVREDSPGDKRLIAYCVTDLAAPPQINDLRDFLSQQVPNYMVPAAFVLLNSLPMTANGKVDRRALPVPELLRQDPTATFVAPRDPLEQQLTQIWQRVLQTQSIGIRDNFFELGGHSLIAVRLFTEIEKTWGKSFPLATIFQAQTIEKLANILVNKVLVVPWSSLVPLQTQGSNPPLFVIHSIGGNILEYYRLSHHLGQNQPVYALQSQGLDGKKEPLITVEDMASHYLQEIQTIQPQGPYFLAGFSFGGVIAYEIAQQLSTQGQSVDFLAMLDTNCPNLIKTRPSAPQAIQIHLNNLRQLEFRRKLKYLWDRVDYRLSGNKPYRELLIETLSKTIVLTPEYIKVLDNNLQANQNYVAKTYSGKITLFRSQVQNVSSTLHPDLGWTNLLAGGLEIQNCPGDHFNLLKEPDVRVVAQKMQDCLQQAQLKK
jgi:amino acid adenylation domain-containing protein